MLLKCILGLMNETDSQVQTLCNAMDEFQWMGD